MKSEIKTDRLLSCRRELGITQKEAAELIGVTQPAYQRYEAGTRTPSVQTIKEMARVFRTSAAYLTGACNLEEADSITINRSETPLLYSVVESCRSCSEAQLHRLKLYLNKLS